jgi:hypothetical protein
MCGYLVEPTPITEHERPDRVGAILHRSDQFGVHLDECAPGGILSILSNPFWGPNLRRDLRNGRVLLLSFHGDPRCCEAMHVRRKKNGIGCALPTCNPDGSPVIVPVHPVHTEQHEITLFPREQNFRLDADELVQGLGDRESVVVLPRGSETGAPRVPSRFMRRQAEVLRVLLGSLRGTPTAADACLSH